MRLGEATQRPDSYLQLDDPVSEIPANLLVCSHSQEGSRKVMTDQSESPQRSERDAEVLRFVGNMSPEQRVMYHDAFVADIFEFWRQNGVRPLIECEYESAAP